MKFLLAIFLSTLLFFAKGQTKNPFNALKFDKVIMYDFIGGKGTDLSIVDDNNKLAKSVIKQVQLDSPIIKILNNKLVDKKSYGGSTASCFDPHLGFVYFYRNNIVGHITICLDCNRLVSSINISAQKQGKVGQGDNTYYLNEGLSKNFRHFINSLLKKMHFLIN